MLKILRVFMLKELCVFLNKVRKQHLNIDAITKRKRKRWA